MAFLKVWATDSGAIGLTSDGRALRVRYKPNTLIGYLDTSLNNAITKWYNVTTSGGVIAFDGTKGIYIEKTETANPPSYVFKHSKDDAKNYKPKFDWSGTKAENKKSVFTTGNNPPQGDNRNSEKSVFAINLSGNNSGGSGSGISFGGSDPNGKDYTKYYLIGGAIILFLILK